MKPRRVNIDIDYSNIVSMYNSWDYPPVLHEFFPTIGYIVDGVCCGFLYQTDSKVAYIQRIVSNKKSDKAFRSICLDLIIKELKECAKMLGYTVLICPTDNTALSKRFVEKHGFESSGFNCDHLMFKET